MIRVQILVEHNDAKRFLREGHKPLAMRKLQAKSRCPCSLDNCGVSLYTALACLLSAAGSWQYATNVTRCLRTRRPYCTRSRVCRRCR